MPIHELDPRRKNADPENEPDFYAISKMYPLETIPQPRVAPVVQEMTGAPGMVGGFNPSGSGTGQQIQPFFPQHDPFQPYPFTPHMGDMPSTPHHQPSVANLPNIPQHQPSHGQMPAAPQHQQPSLLPYPPPDTAHFPMQNMPMMMPPLPGAQANIPNEPYHPQQWTEQEEVARLPSLDRFRPMDTVLGTSWQQHQQQAQQQQQQQQHPLPPPEYYNKPPDPMQFSHMAHYPPMAAAKELPHPFEHPGPTRAVAHSLLERNISDQATSSEESDSKVSPTFVKRNDHSFS